MNTLKPGDKVKQKSPTSLNGIKELQGHTGVIVHRGHLKALPYVYPVDFGFSFEEGHNLDGLIHKNTGRWYRSDELELVNKEFDDDEWE